jgi:hypothetical protein
MKSIMRTAIVPLALAGLTLAACRATPRMNGNLSSNAKGAHEEINAISVFGGASVNMPSVIACAGRIPLSTGSATVKDGCFTGDTNVVVCTDTTSISAVRCEPSAGALLVGGSGNDIIAYARMR